MIVIIVVVVIVVIVIVIIVVIIIVVIIVVIVIIIVVVIIVIIIAVVVVRSANLLLQVSPNNPDGGWVGGWVVSFRSMAIDSGDSQKTHDVLTSNMAMFFEF